jgi:hypothetical protein
MQIPSSVWPIFFQEAADKLVSNGWACGCLLKMMGVSDIFGQMTVSRLLQNVEKMGEALNCWLSTMTCRYHSQASPKPRHWTVIYIYTHVCIHIQVYVYIYV